MSKLITQSREEKRERIEYYLSKLQPPCLAEEALTNYRNDYDFCAHFYPSADVLNMAVAIQLAFRWSFSGDSDKWSKLYKDYYHGRIEAPPPFERSMEDNLPTTLIEEDIL
jgi:hypothetical protein